MVEIIIIAIALVFNFIILKVKMENGNYLNAVIDALVFIVIAVIMGGTLGGMVIAAVASAIFSIYLMYYPVGKRYY